MDAKISFLNSEGQSSSAELIKIILDEYDNGSYSNIIEHQLDTFVSDLNTCFKGDNKAEAEEAEAEAEAEAQAGPGPGPGAGQESTPACQSEARIISEICQPGTFWSIQDSKCKACDTQSGRYQDKAGRNQCKYCSGRTGNEVNAYLGESLNECLPCPAGMDCSKSIDPRTGRQIWNKPKPCPAGFLSKRCCCS